MDLMRMLAVSFIGSLILLPCICAGFSFNISQPELPISVPTLEEPISIPAPGPISIHIREPIETGGQVPNEPGNKQVVGMANPASVYCEANGGKVDIRHDAAGDETGYCVFPDGSSCEEWAFYNGECGPSNKPNPEPKPKPTPITPGCDKIIVQGHVTSIDEYCDYTIYIDKVLMGYGLVGIGGINVAPGTTIQTTSLTPCPDIRVGDCVEVCGKWCTTDSPPAYLGDPGTYIKKITCSSSPNNSCTPGPTGNCKCSNGEIWSENQKEDCTTYWSVTEDCKIRGPDWNCENCYCVQKPKPPEKCNGAISGHVYNAATRKQIIGALLCGMNEVCNGCQETDRNGFYEFSPSSCRSSSICSSTTYNISCSAEGFHSLYKEVTTNDKGNAIQNFYLVPYDYGIFKFWVVDRNMNSIPGAQVLIDDTLIGISDANGEVIAKVTFGSHIMGGITKCGTFREDHHFDASGAIGPWSIPDYVDQSHNYYEINIDTCPSKKS